jgi:photosystem II stability/assembly factor-like uncharacterized protein
MFSRNISQFACLAIVLVGCGSETPATPNGPTTAAGGGSSTATSSGPSGGGAGGTSGSTIAATGGAGGSSSTGGSAGSGGRDEDATVPPSSWANVTSNLANMPSECGNLGLVAAQPNSDMVIAGVAQKGLWATHDGGKTWSSLGTGAGSDPITNRISSIVWDPDHAGTFWESGIYNGAGVYKTTDNGVTFTKVGNATHNDSVSVDLSDPARKTMLAGPHEAQQKLFRSMDAGATWTDIGASLPAGSGFCTSTLVMNANTFLVGCNGGGIFRSTNAGGSWTQVSTKGVIAQPLWASNKNVYWSGNGGGVQKSTDQGQTFSQVADGNTAALVIPPTTLAELPDGRIVVVGKDHLQATADGGQTWKPIGDKLPFKGGGFDGAAGVTYSVQTKTFFTWYWTCNNTVAPDAIASMAFDYTTQ